MIGLYRAIVELIDGKAQVEQAKALSILDDCGIKMSVNGDGVEVLEVESEAEPAEPEGHSMGFTSKPKGP